MSDHCWHFTGTQLPVLPPIDVMKCCFCGATGHLHSRQVDPPEHGQFADSQDQYVLGEIDQTEPVNAPTECRWRL